jgi:aminomethyltransferase
VITSGIPSPSTGNNIAMGYVSPPFHKKGSEVFVEVRGKMRSAKVEAMPFIKVGYFRG